jgi:hypothetical protein
MEAMNVPSNPTDLEVCTLNVHLSIVKPTRCAISQIYLFWIGTLHVSDGLSVHHRGSKTVRTASDIRHMSYRFSQLPASRQLAEPV